MTMKYTLLIAYFFLSFGAYSSESEWRLGVFVSPMMTDFYGPNLSYYTPKFGFGVGMNLERHMGEKLSLMSGVEYSMNGAIYTTTSYLKSAEYNYYKLNLSYLTIPVLLRFQTKGSIKFYIAGGGFLSFLTGFQLSVKEGNEYIEFINSTKGFNTIDAGLAMETGFSFPFGEKATLDIGLKERLGMMNVIDIKNNTNPDILKTNSFGLLLRLKLNL